MRHKLIGAVGGALILGVSATVAVASEQNAARLGNDLTPMGSLKAGSADGRIPAWDGGLEQMDVDLSAGEIYFIPFDGDERLYTITAENMDQYADRLTEGHKALFNTYPDTYKMEVFPTRRSASYPDRAYEWAKENARNAYLEGSDGLNGAIVTWPFPVIDPDHEYAAEMVMWNHKANFVPQAVQYHYNQVLVTSDGTPSLVRMKQELLYNYSRDGITAEEMAETNMQFYFIQRIISPSRLAGNVVLVHETLNQEKEARQAWLYNPGQRRVRRAPNLEHDNPAQASDGLRTNDQNNVFNGALERYDWELVGMRELYLPYNGYGLLDLELTLDDLVRPGHLNQDLARYELHRAWVVDATVKEGTRHLYARRTFYVDPDSWRILAVDVYDNRGNLWRVQEGHIVNLYNIPFMAYAIETGYDLQSRRYALMGVSNMEDPATAFNYDDFNVGPDYFSPSNLRRLGRR